MSLPTLPTYLSSYPLGFASSTQRTDYSYIVVAQTVSLCLLETQTNSLRYRFGGSTLNAPTEWDQVNLDVNHK